MDGEVKIELKYCERCGGLWLRDAGDPQVYCAACAPAMREMSIPRKRAGRAQLPVYHAEHGGATCA